MDPNYQADEDEGAQAMAAAMGFSGFGKATTKKRKFNSATDAFVEGQELEKLDKGGRKGQGSGGNTIPLGKPRVFGGVPALETSDVPYSEQGERLVVGNGDAIDLGEDMDDEEAGPNYIDSSKTPPIDTEGYESVELNKPPEMSEEEAQEMQTRVATILARIGGDDTSSSSAFKEPSERIEQYAGSRPESAYTAFVQGGQGRAPGHQKDPHDSASVASSSRQSYRGEQNPTWYIDYYDPAFNENPWDGFEKEKGLEPLSKWPENVGRRQQI